MKPTLKEELFSQLSHITPASSEVRTLTHDKWQQNAKPLGSLGVLEEQVEDLCALTETLTPNLSQKAAVIFCADNGVVEEGVSQTGQEVTAIVAEQLRAGRSSVNMMASVAGADVIVVDAGIAPNGTANMTKGPAMTEERLAEAVLQGINTVRNLQAKGYTLLAAGEMGIGNTTTSSAVVSALLGVPPETVTGKGAGLSDKGLQTKIKVIETALAVNGLDTPEPMTAQRVFETLRCVGGLDLAGMCGLYLGGALYKVPVLMDGFPSSVAALCAAGLCPNAKKAMFASHVSAEPAGQMVVNALGKEAPIHAGLRLGEGTGAVAAMPLLEMALTVFLDSYTFEEGGIEPYQPL